jgi:hypothetical protein
LSITRAVLVRSGIKVISKGVIAGARVTVRAQLRIPAAHGRRARTVTIGSASVTAHKAGTLSAIVRVGRSFVSTVRRSPAGTRIRITASGTGKGLTTVTRTITVKLTGAVRRTR